MEKVTFSVALAIRFMLDLVREDAYVFTKCPALKPALWCNFLFFRRVRPLPIRKLRRIEPHVAGDNIGTWIVERDVEFYLKDRLIGVVTLRGEKYDRDRDHVAHARDLGLDVQDVLSAWAVSHVWYYCVVATRDDACERIETDVPFTSLTSGQV